jgi:hypothetical protein
MNKPGILGWILLLLIGYCTLGAVVYTASLLLLQNGVLFDAPWIVSAQKSLYRNGMSNRATTWLRPDCITYDPDLIYKPSIGSCGFDDIEFRTILSFTDEGRNTGIKPGGTGIAVIGDSHAMGWGVNDLETFSSQLQKLTGRPVFNLGVASYGTARELIRLEKAGILDRVDTVIIQYCNNDFSENINLDLSSSRQLFEKLTGQFRQDAIPEQTGRISYVLKGYWLTLKAPFKSLADRLRRKNFKRHYGPLMSIIGKHYDVLRDKRVIVFYSNSHGQKYRNFPAGRDSQFPDVYFVDVGLDWSDHYKLDNHPTPAGHQKIAERLFEYLQATPQLP